MHVALKGRLHAQVPLGRDVVRGREQRCTSAGTSASPRTEPRSATARISASEDQPPRRAPLDEQRVHLGQPAPSSTLRTYATA